ncbi:MAG: 2-amino-4-hydroxy-6-hydroxymethyldihydropteridine diphosphokinase [Deferribacterales bacterium]
MRKKNLAVLGLGTNLGRKSLNLALTVKKLAGFLDIVRVSSVYKTSSLLKDSQNDYFNMCVLAETDFEPLSLLRAVKNLEKTMGREDLGRWYSRVIDIDIIDYGGLTLKTPELTLPHPEMENRSFVLLPLREIYPDYHHPVHCRSIENMVNNIKDDLGISKLGVCSWLL